MNNILFLTKIIDGFHKGWLNVELLDGFRVDLPYSTKVELLDSDDRKQIVRLLETDKKGSIAFIPYLTYSGHTYYSLLSSDEIHFKKTILVLDTTKKAIILGGRCFPSEYSKEIIKGRYYIKFPVKKPHLSKKYSNEKEGGSRFAMSWFPICQQNEFNFSRFFHYGLFSGGCIVLKHSNNKHSNWPFFFFELLHSRINDKYLAYLDVI